MKVAVIGCGMMGSAHVKTVAACGAQPVSIDHNRERGAVYASFKEALDEHGAFDAAMICTPAVTHAAVAKNLLRTGYRGPLFVEKPLATTPEETEIFRRWPHPTTMVGYMLRFDPVLAGIKQTLDIRGGDLFVHYDTSEWTASKYPMWRWLECSHELDLALWMGAQPDFKHVAGLLQSEDRQWHVRVSAGTTPFKREWSLRGVDTEVRLAAGDDRMEPAPVPDDGKGLDRWLAQPMYRNMVDTFLKFAFMNAPTPVPFSEGANVVAVLAAAGLNNVQDDSRLEA